MLYRRQKKRWGLRILLAIVVVLVAARLVLPYALEAWIERKPGDSPYVVTLDDLDLNLWRGAYEVEGLRIERTDFPEAKEPFFAAQKVDLSIEWREIIRGTLVGEAVFHKPVLHYVTSEREPAKGPAPDWRERLESMFPFRINRIAIHDGSVAYARRAAAPFTARLDAVEGELTNLTNAAKRAAARPAKLELAAKALNGGKLAVKMTANPFAAQPEFALDAQLTGVRLVDAGDALRALANVDVAGGMLDMFINLEATDGKFTGTARPMFEGVALSRWQEDEGEGALSQLRQGLAKRLEQEAQKFTGGLPDRFSARIPVAGALPADMNVWAAAGVALRAAAADALSTGLERMLGEKLRSGG